MENPMFFRIYFIVLVTIVLVSILSCSVLQTSETEIFEDATPPPGYDPVFITGVKQFDPDNLNSPKIEISSIDTRDPVNIKVKFHMSDERNFYLTGAAQNKFQDIWCWFTVINGDDTLETSEFKIKEVTEASDKPHSISVVMDHSGSMGEYRAIAVQKGVRDMISKKRNQDNMALIRYDDKVAFSSTITGDKDFLLRNHYINGLENFGGMTAIADAVKFGTDALLKNNNNSNKAVIVFTDGYDNSSKFSKDTVISNAVLNNTLVCAVDFGADIDENYMKDFSASTGGTYHHIYKTSEFSLVFEDIYNRLSKYYVLEFKPETYGNQELKIKICLPDDTLSAEAQFDNTPEIGDISLLRINFDSDKATLKKDSKKTVKSIYTLLKAYPEMIIELRGHTDNSNRTNDPDYNIKLSQKRADAVKTALVKMGISGNRIESIGFGDQFPVADNTTEDGKKQNRRTEFIILSK